MKNISTTIKESLVNEARQVEYRVALAGCLDKDGAPMSVAISVDAADAKQFEKFLADEEGNTFLHADGDNIEY